ncbi:MAG: molybdopterin-dependent oxidoreductase, partial [bacterium]|nr:molybdopterin-dependent oxidoreductase [bacterium]
PRLIKNGGYGSIGPYRVDNAWVDSYAVYTNVTPAGGFRGYAIPQVTWAYERQMDEMARGLGIDPLEMRLRNLVHEGDSFSTGQRMSDMHFPELLRRVTDEVGWKRPPAPDRDGPTVRGRGIAVGVKGTVTPSTSTAALKLNDDGSLSLLTSTTEVGQGSRTILAQIAADAVGVPLDAVAVSYPDTEITPWDQTTSSSRSTMVMGDAIRHAGDELRDQVRQLASAELEAAPEDLEIGDGRVWVRGVPNRTMTLGEVVRRTRAGNVLAAGTCRTEGGLDPETGQGIATSAFHQAACAVEVDVDRETGKVRVVDLALATWAGKVIHPTFAQLQSEGNVAFGVGQALMEEIVVQDGTVVNPSLADYLIPSIADLPASLRVSEMEEEDGAGHAHGLGESGCPVVPAAIGNAIADATGGAQVRTLPLTPEKVLRALDGYDDPAE